MGTVQICTWQHVLVFRCVYWCRGELERVGSDFGIEPDENELLDLLVDEAKEIETELHQEEADSEPIPPIEGLVKKKDGSLYYNNEKVKRITEVTDNEPDNEVVYENPDEEVEEDENPEKVKSIMPVTRMERVKSVRPIKSIKQVKSVTPVKSIQEVKSIKEIKSIQEVPDDIARRFIKNQGLISSTGDDAAATYDTNEVEAAIDRGNSEVTKYDDVNGKIELAKKEIKVHEQTIMREKAEIEDLEKMLELKPETESY